MLLYNTLPRTKEPFVPSDGRVGVYVCGVTPYDTTHLGHAKTYVVFDVLVRYLEFQRLSVKYVQNVTDVDDDILRKSRELGVSYLELGELNTRRFLEDMDALNVRRPDHFPRATGEIRAMIEMISMLMERGHAYQAQGNVYFSVSSDPDYGKLSRLGQTEMLELARERGGNPDDDGKADPLDFLLWQGKQPGEPSWPSPWGEGRPGWHIECSAMARRYLGQPVDIHGGGTDLIFPHHESEIAQAECSDREMPFVRYWMHVGMVRLNGEKMSKSLGNMVFVRDLLREFSADGVRLYILSEHYRASRDFDRERLQRMERLAGRLKAALAGDRPPAEGERNSRLEAFLEAMDDDLDTPRAIGILEQLGEAAVADQAGPQARRAAQQALLEAAGILGLRGS